MKDIHKKLCLRCLNVTLPKGRALYCGSYKRKIGCSYKIARERQREYSFKWRQKNPDASKNIEASRKKRGYYQIPHVKARRSKNRLALYHKSKSFLITNNNI